MVSSPPAPPSSSSASSSPPALLANGDVPLADGGGTLTVADAQQASAATANKVGVVSGKKQATVKAVPRTEQPLPTAQEKVHVSFIVERQYIHVH